MTYINAYCGVMQIERDDVLGNQSPLDYIAAIRDIYLPLKTGCSTAIIPKEYFMEPNILFDYMNNKNVTSVGWSVSAFTILSSLGAFEEVKLNSLRKNMLFRICYAMQNTEDMAGKPQRSAFCEPVRTDRGHSLMYVLFS